MVSALYITHLGGGSFISVVSDLYTTHLGGGEGALYLWSLPYIQHT